MRVAHGKVEFGTLRLSLVTHTDQAELFLEAFGHTNHHVVHQLAQGTAHRVGFAGVVRWRKAQLAAIVHHRHQRILGQRQDTTSTLDADLIILDRDIHACGDGYGHFSYTRHFLFLLNVTL